MGTTAQKLNKILETKEAIRTAINNKGGTLTTTDTFASYPSAIDSLPSGGTDWLKEFLDETKNARGLFCGLYDGSQSTWGKNLTYERLQKILSYDTTSSVTNMVSMFENCSKLTTIDITHMNIGSINTSSYFASGCKSLIKLIIRNMNSIPKLNSNAFTNCYHFTGTTDATYNPQGLKDVRIYVPDDKVDALKTATNWSTYADIIVPLSTLVE